MNVICDELRSTITVQHLSTLMFVSLVGPPLAYTCGMLNHMYGLGSLQAGVMLQQWTVHGAKNRRLTPTQPHSLCGSCCELVTAH